MRVVLEVFKDGHAGVWATSEMSDGEYWRPAKPDEIIEGRAVKDYEPGMHELSEIPPEPEDW